MAQDFICVPDMGNADDMVAAFQRALDTVCNTTALLGLRDSMKGRAVEHVFPSRPDRPALGHAFVILRPQRASVGVSMYASGYYHPHPQGRRAQYVSPTLINTLTLVLAGTALAAPFELAEGSRSYVAALDTTWLMLRQHSRALLMARR